MKVHRQNIAIALQIAISTKRENEKLMGFTRDSALVAGLSDTLRSIENGDDLEFYSTDRHQKPSTSHTKATTSPPDTQNLHRDDSTTLKP